MATSTLSLEERLSAYPQLRERLEALLAIVEDPTATVTRADEAERQVIAEVRRLGNAALCSWAAQHEAAQRARVGQQGTAQAGKKNSTGIRRLGKSA
jgi:histidinol dehydrogenase